MASRIMALRQERASLTAEGTATLAAATAGNRGMTAEEKQRDDAIQARLDVIADDLTREERQQAREKALILADAGFPAETVSGGAPALDAIAGVLTRTYEAERTKRYAASRHLSVFTPQPGFSGSAPGGEYLQAIADSAIAKQTDPRLYAVATGGAAGIPGEGGFLIRSQWSDILLQGTREDSKLLPRTTTIPIGAGFDSFEAPYLQMTDRSSASTRFGGVQVYRRAEADSVTGTKIDQLKKFELRLEDMMAILYMTGRLLRDAVAMQAYAENAVTSAFGFKIDDELIRGTGAGQCLGVLGAPCLVTQNKETNQAADTFIAENAINMFSRLKPSNIAGASWYMNPALFAQLPKMAIAVGTGGFPVYNPPTGISGAPYGLLWGRPVEPLEQCSAPGDLGDVILADFSDYLTIEKGGMQTAESQHVRFIYDEMTFRFMYAMNGQPKEPAPITPYKGSATLSAFVTLQAR